MIYCLEAARREQLKKDKNEERNLRTKQQKTWSKSLISKLVKVELGVELLSTLFLLFLPSEGDLFEDFDILF